MQFTTRAHRKFGLKGEKNGELYPYAIQFYREPPTDTIMLEEFERLALERLQVLRIVEHVGAKHNRNTPEYRDVLLNQLRSKKLSSYYKPSTDKIEERIYHERKQDNISHFILRLAYCKNEALRKWFITQELDLFRMRFISEKSTERVAFMKLNQLDYESLDDVEKKELLPKLSACSSSVKANNSSFYKVPFTEVLDLVTGRRVYLKDGLAYITELDFVSIVVSAFRSHLSHALTVASRALPQLEEDGRLMNVLGNINQRYVGTDYANMKNQFSGEVSPEMLDELAKASFPLCMRSLHEKLRESHHLKYFGRLQYGLYLKGIGLSLEDALRFWREEFSKVMDIDKVFLRFMRGWKRKFDKAYAYAIRFNYGKEGKRTNYTPYSCMKIITSGSPGAGECHGCPYKHWDTSILQRKLSDLKIGNTTTTEIMDLTKNNHYQLACTKYFEAMHNESTVDQAIQHPNHYFIESQKIRKGDAPKGRGCCAQIATSKAVMYGDTKAASEAPQPSDEQFDDFEMTDIEDLLKGI